LQSIDKMLHLLDLLIQWCGRRGNETLLLVDELAERKTDAQIFDLGLLGDLVRVQLLRVALHDEERAVLERPFLPLR